MSALRPLFCVAQHFVGLDIDITHRLRPLGHHGWLNIVFVDLRIFALVEGEKMKCKEI